MQGLAKQSGKTLALDMLRSDPKQTEFVDFLSPFGNKLRADNRWVKLASFMPWAVVEECYAESLAGTGMGRSALPGRVAFGALIIKERLGTTDEETAEQIRENLYLQFFLGLSEFREEFLFDPSMMVHFRARFGEEAHQRINTAIIEKANPSTQGKHPEDNDDDQSPPPANAGKLLVDATCTPADITYPTDLKLLAEAREKTEAFIDILHESFIGQCNKPRTYRQQARKRFLTIAKQKKPGRKKIRKAIGQQLRYLRRNLKHIEEQLRNGANLSMLSNYQYKSLLVIHEVYRQQEIMYRERTHRIPDRIVSISQPHVRPIVRGKAGKPVEFGAKISLSHLPGGFVTLDRLSWDAYNEQGDLIGQIESYRQRHGYYPESVHADTIYRNRANRSYCKERKIRLSGKPLGRPPKPTESNREMLKAMKKQNLADEHARIPVEGKFGNAKRKGTLGRIMAKLRNTSESVIHIGMIVLNLDTWLRAELKSLLDALITCVQDKQRQVRRLMQAVEELTGAILRKMRESQAENRRTRILGILGF